MFDLDSVQLLWTLRTMRDQHVLLSGRKLDPAPDCFLGAVENPFAPPVEFRAGRLGKKVDGRRAVRADPVRLRRPGVRPVAGAGP